MSDLPATATASPRDRFLTLVGAAAENGTLVKLTLGKYRGADATLRNVFVRPVELKAGRQLSFVWRHETRDVTKNHPVASALTEIGSLLAADFHDAHLFTTTATAQLERQEDGRDRLRVKQLDAPRAVSVAAAHDRPKTHLIDPASPWLQTLGVTNDRSRPREGMADKFRQIEKYAELLGHLLEEAFPPATPLSLVDMGCGKGYLTFAVAALLGLRARVRGVEARPELVALCNRAAARHGFGERLQFTAGTIADTPLDPTDVLIALHACDTATDDALAKGIAAGARLLVVAPCCQKELRPQLVAPPVLAPALRHGIFQERHAEFATDALRALLLEWVGYETKVFEFISTEHTAKNVMIAAIRRRAEPDPARAAAVRDLAAFYGVRTQQLARQLGFELSPP